MHPSEEPTNEELASVALAVLCLIEGAKTSLADSLRGMASEEVLTRHARRMAEGERERRARAMAAPLGRLALDLQRWSL